MDQAAVITTGLTRTFGDTVAVDRLDLTIPTGQIHALLGPNGSGKTTTVRMLCGLLAPTAGTATVAGHDITTEPDSVRADLGVALQETGLDPLATAMETLILHGQLHGLPTAQARSRADELLDLVDLAGAADQRTATMSGGMRRRLDLAVALISRPSVLFLDEPTTGLDPISRRTLWNEVRAVNNEGVTVLLTTQYLEEADQLADNVTILHEGRIVTAGTPNELKAGIGGDRISIELPEPDRAAARDLIAEELPTATTVIDPDGLTVHTPDGLRHLAPLAARLTSNDLHVGAITVTQPTLDDVFLRAVGHHLPHIPTANGLDA